MKKFLAIILCSTLSLQAMDMSAQPEQPVVTTVIVNAGSTPEQKAVDTKKAKIFDCVHGTLALVTFCTVANITRSVKLATIAVGTQLYVVSKRSHNQDSFICQYGDSIGMAMIVVTACRFFKKLFDRPLPVYRY